MLPLILGLLVGALGALISYLTGTWHISFIISLTAAAISLVASSILQNVVVISKKKGRIKGQENKSANQTEAWIKAIAMFGFPNAVITLLLYIRLYR